MDGQTHRRFGVRGCRSVLNQPGGRKPEIAGFFGFLRIRVARMQRAHHADDRTEHPASHDDRYGNRRRNTARRNRRRLSTDRRRLSQVVFVVCFVCHDAHVGPEAHRKLNCLARDVFGKEALQRDFCRRESRRPQGIATGSES